MVYTPILLLARRALHKELIEQGFHPISIGELQNQHTSDQADSLLSSSSIVDSGSPSNTPGATTFGENSNGVDFGDVEPSMFDLRSSLFVIIWLSGGACCR